MKHFGNKMKKALILNNDYSPLGMIDVEKALVLWYLNKVEIVDLWRDEFYKTVNSKFEVPSVIRLLKYTHCKWRKPSFRRLSLFERDNWTCAYCGKQLNIKTATIDHILPRSRGGSNSWNNCVTSCVSCNYLKDDKTLGEAGMKLLIKPKEPKVSDFWDKGAILHDAWNVYL